MSMKYKNLILQQLDGVTTQLDGLISALETNKVSKADSLIMLKRIQKGVETINNTVSLEDQNFFTSDKK